MFKSMGRYNITEEIHEICQYLHNHRTPIRRCNVVKLFKDYIDENISKTLIWSKSYNPFTHSVEFMFDDDEVIRNLFDAFDKYANYLISSISNDLELNKYSFILSEISSSSKGVILIVENSGDYRIVEHELRERGVL